MKYWTYAEIKEKVEKDLGLEDETFLSPEELLSACNEAIAEAEAEIHTLYEDYFLTKHSITLVTGTDIYDMPTNIYANKVRGVIFKKGITSYEVKRFGEMNKFSDLVATEQALGDAYKYLLFNDSAEDGVKIKLTPTVRAEDNAGELRMFYLRAANVMVNDASICDIPEFVHFVIQFMKVRAYEKETHSNLNMAIQALELKRKQMINTLTNMVPDGDTAIQKDLSFYWETN